MHAHPRLPSRPSPSRLMSGVFLMLALIAAGARAQDQIEIIIRSNLGSATQVVMPQTRSFTIEGRGEAVVIEKVEGRVRILDATATTTLEVSLRNASPRQAEAVLLLPVPDGAVVGSFLFEGASTEPTAQVMRRDEARRLYDAIVAKVRDPALLEFAGYNLIRSSVFPIEAGGTQKIRLTYEHLLPVDGDRVDYLLPRSESLDRRAPWHVEVDVQSKEPVSTVYSPSHTLETERRSPNHLSIRIAESSRLDPGSFRLSYLRERHGVTASLYAYPDPKIEGGYFLLVAGLPADAVKARDEDVAARGVKREVTLVIDRSGSMAGVKMDQAKAAALQVLEGLDEGEAFNIIDFSTTVSMLAAKPVEKNSKSAAAARVYLDMMRAGGGTNIHDALVEALKVHETTEGRLPLVLFLTDGLPTVGRTSEVDIRELVEKGNPQGRRIFTFGVGHDVNVPLLDRLSDATRAVSVYVNPEEDVELKVAQTFRRLSGPILANAALDTIDAQGEVATGAAVRELIPSALPDLFDGDQLIVLGQYRNGGGEGGHAPIRFRLAGEFLGEEKVFEFEFDLESATTRNAFVPRLWASRRIAYLVDQIRQAGAASGAAPHVANAPIFDDPRYRELAEEILRLSTEFGILTEYTAFLATEGTNLSDWNSLQATCNSILDGRAVQERWGMGAVNQGVNFNEQKVQSKVNYQNAFVDEKLNRVEIASVQQVCDRAFFKRGAQWIDSQLVTETAAQSEAIEPDETIEFGSAEHIAILHRLIEQNRQGVLSLSGDIMLRFDGRNILIRNTTPTP
ncbi:MAG: VWA domain-containing protein [Phycisphaerales bacterium]|nr:VWA domain-containing protein [Phycisphaerales bacterium]